MKHGNDVKPKKKRVFLKIILILIILVGLAGGGIFALKVAPNYVNNDITDRDNLVLNYSNVTGRMKHNLFINDNGVVYLSLEDVKNYYDKYSYYDKQYNQIVTSTDTKLAVFKLDENKVTVNGEEQDVKGGAIAKNGVYYLPISEMDDIYNIKTNKVGNKVVIESLDRKLTTANAKKNIELKSKATIFSRTIEKINSGDKLFIAETEENSLPKGWIRVRTQNGNLGYVQESKLDDKKVEREQQQPKKVMNEKVSLAWDYFSEYGKAPDNTGVKYDGVNVVSPSFFYLKLKDTEKENLNIIDVSMQANINENVGENGTKYIKWAHDNNYKVWAKFSNETLSTTIDEFSLIINDYSLRSLMISQLLNYVDKYDLDGINLDFEYMYKDDNEAFSRFIIELAPRLRAKGKCLSVDVTAPDGGENWSLCYNRNLIADISDYIVFMAYDQYGTTQMGTTAGYNWIEKNINKFINNEGIESDKIILALPFYTKLWQTKNGAVIKGTAVGMSNVASSIPSFATKEWNEDLQQYYVEYDQNGYTYKMWVEDEQSFTKKIELVNKYNLAGAGYWRKGLEPASIWTVIKSNLGL